MQVSSEDICGMRSSLSREGDSSKESESNKKRDRINRISSATSGDVEMAGWQTINGCLADGKKGCFSPS